MRNTEKTYKKLLVKISQNLKKARKNKKLRQAEMIEYGFSERFVQKIESGKHSPNLYTIHRFAEAYDVQIVDLLI